MASGRIVRGGVAAWLRFRAWARRRGAARAPRWIEATGQASLITPFGALCLASPGAGAGWLPLLLVGMLREWPVGSPRAALGDGRVVAAGRVPVPALPS